MGKIHDRARLRAIRWRTKAGMSQTVLARKLGWSQPSYSKWERGGIETDLETLDAIARYLGHTLAELLDPTTPDNPPSSKLVAMFNALPDEEARQDVLRMVRRMLPKAEADGPE